MNINILYMQVATDSKISYISDLGESLAIICNLSMMVYICILK